MQAIEVAGNALSGHLSVEFLIRAAVSVRAQGDRERAMELLERAVANEPASRLAVQACLQTAAQEQRWERLLRALEAGLRQNPDPEDQQRLQVWRADVLGFQLDRAEEAQAAYQAAADQPGSWAEAAAAAAQALPAAPLLPPEAQAYEVFGLGGAPIAPTTELAEALEKEGALAEATEVWLGLLREGAVPAPDALRQLSKLGRAQASGDGVCRGLAAAALADGVSLRRRGALIDKLAHALISMGDEVSAQVLRGAFQLEEEAPVTETGSFRPMTTISSRPSPARPQPSAPLVAGLREQAEALGARHDYWAWLAFAEHCAGAAQLDFADEAFEAAIACAAEPALGAKAARRAAELAEAAQEPRRAARFARQAAELAPGPEASLLLARLSTRAGDPDSAQQAWREVLAAEPGHLEATAALLARAAEDGAREEAQRLMAAAKPEGHDGPARCRWGVSLAQAHGQLDAFEAAQAALSQALEDDPVALQPAESLVALGVRAGEAAWIDHGLKELRTRAFEAGQLERAFLAAAMRVARGSADPAEEAQYRALRARRIPHPRRPLPEGWIGRWLGIQQGEVGDGGPELSEPSATAVSGALTRRAASLASYFGAPAPEVAVAPGSTKLWAAADGRPARLELSAEATQLSFELGRGLAALVEPSLRSGLDPTIGDPGTRTILDRAGLLAVWDPREALAAVGPHSARGLRLIAFSASQGMLGLSAEAGLGLPRA